MAVLKRQLEEKEKLLATEQEDAVAAKSKLRELNKVQAQPVLPPGCGVLGSAPQPEALQDCRSAGACWPLASHKDPSGDCREWGCYEGVRALHLQWGCTECHWQPHSEGHLLSTLEGDQTQLSKVVFLIIVAKTGGEGMKGLLFSLFCICGATLQGTPGSLLPADDWHGAFVSVRSSQ